VYSPHFQLRSFENIRESSRFGVLQFLLHALTAANVAWLLDHPETPMLYESGVRYTEEASGVDEWLDIPEILYRHAQGLPIDCEDLACWRVAELQVRCGEREARHHITVSDIPDAVIGQVVTTYHITVERVDGRIEDPSRLLGMTH
jgi:hypothetical protein